MSIVLEILESLLDTSLYYKGMRVNAFGIPKFENYSRDSVKSTLWKMKKNCLIEKRGEKWHVTKRGRKYVQRKYDSLRQFPNVFKKDAPKNLIVMFDVPETKKVEREWLRWHLKKFHYIMIQRSVWVGPSPLPREFMRYVERIKLKDSIKTFRLARPYSTK